jgi:hypothetical protein
LCVVHIDKIKTHKGENVFMKNLKEKMNKKVVAVTVAGTVVLGSLGGGAYAYKDEWTAKIQEGVSQLANYVYGGAIESAVTDEKNEQKTKTTNFGNKLISDFQALLKAHKQAEIERGTNAVKKHAEDDRATLERVANNALDKEKKERETKTNQAVGEANAEIDAIVDNFLSQVQ